MKFLCIGLIALLSCKICSADAPVELAPFIVTEQNASKPWRAGETDDFCILSQTEDSLTRSVLQALYRGRHIFLPAQLLPRFSQKTIVIIFDEPPNKQNTVAPPYRSAARWVGLIKRSFPDYETFGVNLHRSEWRYSSSFRADAETLLNHTVPRPPKWLTESLFGRYGIYHQGLYAVPYYTDIPHSVRVYTADWWSAEEAGEAGRYLSEAIRMDSRELAVGYPSGLKRFLIPSQLLFQSTPEEVLGSERWSAQLGLFARWALCSHKGRHAIGFWRLAIESPSRALDEEALQRHFGISFEQLDAELSWFLPLAVQQTFTRAVTPFQIPAIRMHPAGRDEVDVLRGTFELGEAIALSPSMPDVSTRYLDLAMARFARCVKTGYKDPRAFSGLAACYMRKGDIESGVRMYRSAVELGSRSPIAYLELARTALMGGGVAEAQAFLAKAMELKPELPEIYLLSADGFRRAENTTAEINVLMDAARKFPRDVAITTKLAKALIHGSRKEEAVQLLEHRIGLAEERAQAQQFEALLSSLRQGAQKSKTDGVQK